MKTKDALTQEELDIDYIMDKLIKEKKLFKCKCGYISNIEMDHFANFCVNCAETIEREL